jgi:hypothetical protein
MSLVGHSDAIDGMNRTAFRNNADFVAFYRTNAHITDPGNCDTGYCKVRGGDTHDFAAVRSGVA